MVNRKMGIKRRIKSVIHSRQVAVLIGLSMIVVAGMAIERSAMNANYADLLSTIARGESSGNYNAYYGHARNASLRFTEMSIGKVLEWQQQYVEQGSPSSAVGRYQFIEPTLRGLIDEMNIDANEQFDEKMQDKLAIRLIERRGVHEYLRGHISREQLAHNLSKEWAALPRVVGDKPNASYYAGDGLNHVQISIDQIFAAIDNLRSPKG